MNHHTLSIYDVMFGMKDQFYVAGDTVIARWKTGGGRHREQIGIVEKIGKSYAIISYISNQERKVMTRSVQQLTKVKMTERRIN